MGGGVEVEPVGELEELLVCGEGGEAHGEEFLGLFLLTHLHVELDKVNVDLGVQGLERTLLLKMLSRPLVLLLMPVLLGNVKSVGSIPRVELDRHLKTPYRLVEVTQHQIRISTVVEGLDFLRILPNTFCIGIDSRIEVVDNAVGIPEIIPAVGIMVLQLQRF